MITFKPDITFKRADGTYNVRVRIIHNRKALRLSTNIYATDADLTKTGKIKNQKIVEQINTLINKCRAICNDMDYQTISNMSINDLVDTLKNKLTGGDKFRLDFIAFANGEIAQMKKSTGGFYTTAFNALKRYIKRDTLDIAEINKDFLTGFEKFIENDPSQLGAAKRKTPKNTAPKGSSRAVSAYLTNVRAMYNRAMEKYNDDEKGIIRIPYYPFKKFKVKSPPKTRKRALSIDVIQSIIDLPPNRGRFELARDCFLLSFGLIGMNSADLYFAEPDRKGIITYNRQKTKDRRDDNAEMLVRIEPCISELVEKYRDKDGKRMFSFYRQYSNFKSLNISINKGLKTIGEELGIDDLEYYAARHSWATIARSAAVGIDKATVHEALNHVDEKMKITDIYIDRDWSVIWDANRKVLNLFDWHV